MALVGFTPQGQDLAGRLDGIVPGSYTATLYFQPNYDGAPAGQFEVRFEIKKGETADLALTEAEMKPYVKPDAAGR